MKTIDKEARAKYAAEDLTMLQSHERELVDKLRQMHHNAPGRPAVEAEYTAAKQNVERTTMALAAIAGEEAIAAYQRLIAVEQVHA